MTFYGKIAAADGNTSTVWGGFRLAFTYTAVFDGIQKLFERSIALRDDGSYSLDPGDPIPSDAVVTVFSPSGEALTRQQFSSLVEEGTSTLKPLRVQRRDLELVIAPVAPPVDLRTRIHGRVFVASGASGDHSSAAALEVRVVGTSGDGAPVIPIFSGITDRSGYFAGPVQRQRLAAASAETGAGPTLVRHAITVTADNWIPQPLLLFIAAKPSAETECGCDAPPPATPGSTELAVNGEAFSADLGSGCQDFTVPNRTLEEFDFFKVVRTTDPTIKGLTLPDTVRTELNLPEVASLAFDRATLSKTLGASSLSIQTAPKQIEQAPLISSDLRRASAPSPDGARTMARLATVVANPDRSAAALTDTNVADYLDVSQLEASGVRRAAEWGNSVEDRAMEIAVRQAVAKIPPAALKVALEDPDGFTPESLMTLERRVSAQALAAYLNWRAKPFAGRGALNQGNPVDWDLTPEFYQATSIAHGHILHFKQEWRADGYSLGELVRSVPLAPGQKKQMAVIAWDRLDEASRTEATESTEAISATLSRDRDIDEIANVAFSESLRGGSRASTAAVGGGFGLAIGPLVIGGGGGAAKASSTAWSDNSRNLTGQTLNQLRDNVSQGASAVRNQRSTVVETVGQRERVTATTEVIANYNRCHALTIQYFEVLRHFAVHERIASAKECLFVPLEMTVFDDPKVLRWHDILFNACRNRAVTPGFEAIRRLNSPEVLPPDRRYADDPIEEMTGSLRIRVSIARPKDPKDATVAVQETEWRFFGMVLNINPEVIYDRYKRDQAKRDRIFRAEIAPEIAHAFLESLQVMLIDRDGREHESGFAITVASRYSENGLMEIELNNTGAGPRLTRAQIAGLSIQTKFDLPEFSKVVVESGSVTYATERFSGTLFNSAVNDDVLKGDPAFLSASQLSRAEERNQLAEMRRLRRRLLRHLNDSIEYYHRAIWLGMDANRRYMLLDGFEAPRSDGRSVASVVENRLVGIVGNCLVMPVAAGFQLDPVLAEALAENEDPQKALERLYEVEPSPPRRLSVPTKGVFAEAMPGKCNSCEVIEEDRFWRWKDFPLPGTPSAISPVSTDSRFAAPGSLRPTALPDALVKFQALPSLPDPTGMTAALNMLGQDVFKDLTGLTNNQKNAMAALTTAMGTSEAFAGEAFKLAMAKDAARNLDRTLEQIKAAKSADLLSPEEASKATRDALLRSIASSAASNADLTTTPEIEEAIKKAAGTPGGSATVTREKGETSESVSFTVDESALTIGRATGHVREYPLEIWVEVPLIEDTLVALNYSDTNRVSTLEAARAKEVTEGKLTNGTKVRIDLIGSAIAGGLMRVNAAGRLETRINATIGYPADPADNNRILRPKRRTKYAFAALIHGNSGAWEFVGAPVDAATPIPGGTLPLKVAALGERGDYRGYTYLQRYLAELARPIVSMSFSHGLPNLLGYLVEMRSELLLAAIRVVMAQVNQPNSPIGDTVDFTSMGILGHSRGGEAVVRAFETPIAGARVKAICSIAPTDVRGASNAHKLTLPASAGVNYLVLYGGLDGDVSGQRTNGRADITGSGFRLYDRAACDKAMVYIPRATHARFNTVWAGVEDNEGGEWAAIENAVALPGVPVRALDLLTHQALANEFVGGFFDLILNGNAAEQARFRNEVRSPTGAAISHQWRFGALAEPIDNFNDDINADRGSRTLSVAASILEFAPIAPVTARDLRVPHQDRSCVLTTAAAGRRTITYEFAPGSLPPGFDALRFRLGRLYPSITQAEINSAIGTTPVSVDTARLRAAMTTAQDRIDLTPPPQLEIVIEDGKNQQVRIPQASLLANQQNGWALPEVKVDIKIEESATGTKTVIARDRTLMSLQTLQVRSSQLTGITASEILRISLEFDMPAAPTEFWLDTIDFVLN
ncbi:MAG TPA: hypothetical protein VER03_23860 [Bryobacteraceae bacterium]|nr:hypothetical protein [Bryobacteraceae bacterium]